MKARLPPWAQGPYELLKHADGHLKSGGDTDRRIALIGFDQAVEVCIDVFLRLHPRLRNGVQIPREEVERAGRTFHSKIEFFERHARGRAHSYEIPFEAIVWYHSLRNELYHSGNGMVPERHVLEGAREAAVRVFGTVFGEQFLALILDSQIERRDPADPAVVPTSDQLEMQFLRSYMSLERTVRMASQMDDQRAVGFPELWREWGHLPTTAPWSDRIMKLVGLRNALVHGEGAESVSQADLKDAIKFANEVSNWVQQAARKRS